MSEAPEPEGDRITPERKGDRITPEPKGDRNMAEPKGDRIAPEPKGDRNMAEPKGDRNTPEPKGDRIAKYLARAGVASRRDAERLLAEGAIRLNNVQVTHPATFVTAGDLVTVNGKLVEQPERTRLWRYHKPEGLVTTHRDPEGRPTVFDKLRQQLPRVISVGRLDLTSEGLLLLTNDGALARTLEMPTTGWIRRYRVRVHGVVDPKALPFWRKA